MQSSRILLLMLIFGATAVALAGLRGAQRRCLVRIQKMRMEQGRLTAEIYEQQLQIARLRSPEHTRQRVQRFELQVFAPGEVIELHLNDLYALKSE